MTISSWPKYFNVAFYKVITWSIYYELYIMDCIKRHDIKDHKAIGFLRINRRIKL